MPILLLCIFSGILPIIKDIKLGGRVIESLETLEATVSEHMGQVLFDACIGGMHWNSFKFISSYCDTIIDLVHDFPSYMPCRCKTYPVCITQVVYPGRFK